MTIQQLTDKTTKILKPLSIIRAFHIWTQMDQLKQEQLEIRSNEI